jgi:outer membrane protein
VNARACLAAALAATLLGSRPAVADEPVLTLSDALGQALGENPSIAASREMLESARNTIDQARAGFLPQAVVAMSYRRSTLNSPPPPFYSLNLTPPAGTSAQELKILQDLGAMFSNLPLSHEGSDSYNTLAASIVVNQTVWDFGRTLGGVHAARAIHDAAGADLATTNEGVAFTVIQAYFGVLAAQETVTAAEETQRQMQKHLDIATAQADGGIRQRVDVSRARSDLENADLNLLRARNGLEMGKVLLDNAIGMRHRTAFRVVRPAAAGDLSLSSADDAVNEALAARPEARALAARVRAAEGQVETARSAFYPSVSVNGSWGWQGYHVDDLPYNWGVGASIAWNALSPVPALAGTRAAEASLRSLQASQRSLELAIRAEVETAILAYGEARQRIGPSRTLEATARETLALAEGRYQAGAGSLVELTDAQAVLIQAKATLIQAEFDLEVARARVLKSLGRLGPAAHGG